jgi:hypothetical protein
MEALTERLRKMIDVEIDYSVLQDIKVEVDDVPPKP